MNTVLLDRLHISLIIQSKSSSGICSSTSVHITRSDFLVGTPGHVPRYLKIQTERDYITDRVGDRIVGQDALAGVLDIGTGAACRAEDERTGRRFGADDVAIDCGVP